MERMNVKVKSAGICDSTMKEMLIENAIHNKPVDFKSFVLRAVVDEFTDSDTWDILNIGEKLVNELNKKEIDIDDVADLIIEVITSSEIINIEIEDVHNGFDDLRTMWVEFECTIEKIIDRISERV